MDQWFGNYNGTITGDWWGASGSAPEPDPGASFGGGWARPTPKPRRPVEDDEALLLLLL